MAEWLQAKPSLLLVKVLLETVKLSVALSIALTCAPCVKLLLKKLFCIRIVALDVFCISTLKPSAPSPCECNLVSVNWQPSIKRSVRVPVRLMNSVLNSTDCLTAELMMRVGNEPLIALPTRPLSEPGFAVSLNFKPRSPAEPDVLPLLKM